MSPISRRSRPAVPLLAGILAVAVLVAACSSDPDDAGPRASTSSAPSETSTSNEGSRQSIPSDGAVRRVPEDHPTIQAAVDAAAPGDLVLIAPGTYHEAVDVTTDAITIRGLDRAGVILDGRFELDNGIRVLDADGVAIENLTAVNYVFNGFFWVGVDGYRASYLTAQRNREYGVYAFDSVNGLIEHSYASGSAIAGFYVGQCFPCNALVVDVWAEYNAVGYLGTNSGGDLTIAESQFNDNRVGILPNSGTYELCYPQRETTIVGNSLFDNGGDATPGFGSVLASQGYGIHLAGGVRNVVERNRVVGSERFGIGVAVYVESTPSDDLPEPDEWDTPCSVQRDEPFAEVPSDELVDGRLFVWDPAENVVRGNVVEASGEADIVVGSGRRPIEELGNCVEGNLFATSRPSDIETLAPCTGTGTGDWSIDAPELDELAGFRGAQGPDYAEADLPPIPDLAGMDDPERAPAAPATDLPPSFDNALADVPSGPLFSRGG